MKAVIVVVGLAACAAPPASSASTARVAPTVAAATAPPVPRSLLVPPARFSATGGGACQVGPSIDLGRVAPENRHWIGIASNTRGALVAYNDGDGTVAVPLTLDGQPSGAATRTREPAWGAALHAQPDGTFVAVTQARCPTGTPRQNACMLARTFDAKATPLEPLATADLGPRRPLGDYATVPSAWGALGFAQPSFPETTTALVVRVAPREGAAATITTTEITGPPRITDMSLSVRARSDGAFVVFARTPYEGTLVQHEGGPAVLVKPGRQELVGADDAAYVQSTEAETAARIAPGGAVSEVPWTSPAIAAARDVLVPVARHVSSQDFTGLVLERRGPDMTAAPPTRIVPNAVGRPGDASVAWTGARFLVAWEQQEGSAWRVHVAPITCAASGPR